MQNDQKEMKNVQNQTHDNSKHTKNGEEPPPPKKHKHFDNVQNAHSNPKEHGFIRKTVKNITKQD